MDAFVPSRNGLRFTNAFPPGPAVTVDLGVTKLKVGNAANGLCGGIVFTALDYWLLGLPPPPETNPPAPQTPLFRYLVRRVIDSWMIPRGPITYLALMNPHYPDGGVTLGPLHVHGRSWRMVRREWPAVRESLDAGRPCPLGLITVSSANPLDIGQNHQVLAYRYDVSGTDVRLAVYDPNEGARDDIAIALDVSAATGPTGPATAATRPAQVTMTSGAALSCFFAVDYAPKTPPPVDGAP